MFLDHTQRRTTFGRTPLDEWSARRRDLYLTTRTRTQHDYHHDTKVKPEAATVVIELLMMGGKTPETC